jgi:hypothetical protein
MELIKEISELFGDSDLDGGSTTKIYKKPVGWEDDTCRDWLADNIDTDGRYSGPGKYFSRSAWIKVRKKYVIVEQTWGLDV